MPYFRHIHVKQSPFDYLTLTVDKNRAVLRILYHKDHSMSNVSEDAKEASADLLKTTQQLATPFITERDKYFVVDGKPLVILCEGILDKTSGLYKRDWVPGAHFVFQYKTHDGMYIDCKGGLTFFNKRNTAELVKYSGGMWIFDLWVRNPKDPVTNCARSITTGENTKLITNVDDLGEVWEAAEVMKGGASQWLNLAYELTANKETVEPDGWVDYTFRVMDGKTKELATDVTWDGFVIEPVDGYVPHRRVTVKRGVGTFRGMALGLKSGEKMRVKVGHRFYTSRAECTVEVA